MVSNGIFWYLLVPKLPIESSTDWVSFGIFWYLIVGEFLIKDTKRYQKVPKDTTKKIVCLKIFSDSVKDFFLSRGGGQFRRD